MLIDIKMDIAKTFENCNYKNFNNNEVGTYVSWLSSDILIIEQKGFNTLLSYNKLSNISKVVRQSSEIIKSSYMDLRKVIALSAILGALGNLISQFVVIALTGFLALNKIISFGSILTIESLSSNIFNYVGNIINLKIEMDTVAPIFKKFEDFENKVKSDKKDKISFNEKICLTHMKTIIY